MKTVSCALISILSMAAIGCGPTSRGDDGTGAGDDTMIPPGDDQPPGPGTPRQCDKMDIVFVVDDSGSMSQEQTNLATNFPMFATVLSDFRNADGNPVDFRIGITTTGRTVDYTEVLPPPFNSSMQIHENGDNGAFRNNCGGSQRWLESSDPNMATSLACRAKVGTGGPSVEMPLLMGKYALAERSLDLNTGFVRPDALLALVMITDEDDQSTTQNHFTISTSSNGPADFQPADAVAYLDGLKGHRSRWAAAAIAGDGACMSDLGDASNAARLKDFVMQANSQGTTQAVFSSICEGNLAAGLTNALNTFQNACGEIIF